MKSLTLNRIAPFTAAIPLALLAFVCLPAAAWGQEAESNTAPIHERIEWTDIWVTNADNDDLPRVLFVGDSITRGYFGGVEKELEGKANCARYATSSFISHQDFLDGLGIILKRYPFDVVHINNGLHGWDYTEEQYREAFPALISLLNENAPNASIIWAMTTPLRARGNLEKLREESIGRVKRRNEIAAEVAKNHGFGTSDLFSLSIGHPDHHRGDGTHFSPEGIAAQSKYVADIVSKALASRAIAATDRMNAKREADDAALRKKSGFRELENGETGSSKPNIILFLVDDMGWQDTSVAFHKSRTIWNELYRTPNMQRLADQGMKFTSAYAAHPVCSPTRVSLMTGKNPARTRVSDWVGHGMSQNRYLRSPSWKLKGLQPDDGNQTLPDILRSGGYRTIHIGKAHFGGKQTPGENPINLGFDVNIAGSHGGGPWGGWYSPWLGKYKAMYPGLEDRPEGEYLTDAITVKAQEIIAEAARDHVPFFMNMAHFAVHTMIAPAPDDYLDHYKDGRPVVERDYASMLEAMDASLGSIMDCLNDPNRDGDRSDSIADNTIVLFMSDNGGLSNHTRSDNGKVTLDGGARVSYQRDYHNTPIKSGKGSAYEGGIRVPMIVAWAGQPAQENPINHRLPIKPGAQSDEPVHADDFFPTILAMATVANPVPAHQLDGRDLCPLLLGDAFERDSGLFWHYPHQWYRDVGVGLGIEPFTAIREGDFKLIHFYGDGVVDGSRDDPRWELYNLANDLGETNNLVGDETEVASALRNKLLDWMKKVDAQTPVSKLTGKALNLTELNPH